MSVAREDTRGPCRDIVCPTTRGRPPSSLLRQAATAADLHAQPTAGGRGTGDKRERPSRPALPTRIAVWATHWSDEVPSRTPGSLLLASRTKGRPRLPARAALACESVLSRTPRALAPPIWTNDYTQSPTARSVPGKTARRCTDGARGRLSTRPVRDRGTARLGGDGRGLPRP